VRSMRVEREQAEPEHAPGIGARLFRSPSSARVTALFECSPHQDNTAGNIGGVTGRCGSYSQIYDLV